MTRPLCFVLMPFGCKPDPAGGPDIDFDAIYERAIKPGIEDASLCPLRADEERLGGVIHRAMFERLMVCDFAVADLTTSNANVMYELGVRHAVRPRTTLTVYAKSSPLPFDVRLLRTSAYALGEANGFPDSNAQALRMAVGTQLRALRAQAGSGTDRDSPLFQLVPQWDPRHLSATLAESFLDQVRESESIKERLSHIRLSGQLGSATSVDAELAEIRAAAVADFDAGVLTEVMLTHRALEDWSGMIEDYQVMPAFLQDQVAMRQQLAFAHNRRAETTGDPRDRAEAITVLTRLESEQGSTSETCGLLGRAYKSQWLEVRDSRGEQAARPHLAKAVSAYVRGFEADWRDVYPGINAVSLLEAQATDAALRLRDRLLPVVRFAAEQRLRTSNPTYWDYATMLEVAVLDRQEEQARQYLGEVLAAYTESWQPRTTATNISLIVEVRRSRGTAEAWTEEVTQELAQAGHRLSDEDGHAI